MALQEDYRVTLDTFQGPLDLLLFLIRRAEVDVTDIPVARITDQYLDFLSRVDDVDVEMAGEFLVMAATLIELKSRTLMPPDSDAPGSGDRSSSADGGLEPTDPRYELVQQLLAYQRYRIASEELGLRRDEFALQHPLRPSGDVEPAPDEIETAAPADLELDDVHLMDLAEAYERIMASIDFSRLGEHVVEIDDTPIALHQEDMLDRLARAADGRLMLHEVFAGREPSQRVGLFLAALELARIRRITILQERIDAEIEVVLSREEQPS